MLLVVAFVIAMTTVTTFAAESEEDEVAEVTAEDIVKTAGSYIGKPYVWGGKSASGLDCSGLVYRTFSDLGFSKVDGKSFPLCTRDWRALLKDKKAHDQVVITGEDGEEIVYLVTSREKALFAEVPGSIILYNGHIVFTCGSVDKDEANLEKSIVDFMSESYDIDVTGMTEEGEKEVFLREDASDVLLIEAAGTQDGANDHGVVVSNAAYSNKEFVACLVPFDAFKEYQQEKVAEMLAAMRATRMMVASK